MAYFRVDVLDVSDSSEGNGIKSFLLIDNIAFGIRLSCGYRLAILECVMPKSSIT